MILDITKKQKIKSYSSSFKARVVSGIYFLFVNMWNNSQKVVKGDTIWNDDWTIFK